MEYWLRCVFAASITIGSLAVGMAIAGFANSFWLIYWIVSATFTVVAWALIGPIRDHFRSKRTRTSA